MNTSVLKKSNSIKNSLLMRKRVGNCITSLNHLEPHETNKNINVDTWGFSFMGGVGLRNEQLICAELAVDTKKA